VPTYLIERETPGASELSDDELRGITQKSNEVVAGLTRPYTWRHSYVAGDKIYCVYDAENPLGATGDARRVVTDSHAACFGITPGEQTLLPGDDAYIAHTRFSDWLTAVAWQGFPGHRPRTGSARERDQ
jgi:hypothetical protein